LRPHFGRRPLDIAFSETRALSFAVPRTTTRCIAAMKVERFLLDEVPGQVY